MPRQDDEKEDDDDDDDDGGGGGGGASNIPLIHSYRCDFVSKKITA